MRLRDQVALTLPSFILRLVLGVTFLWAGTGKLVGTYSVTGDGAARLANIGVMPTAPAPFIENQDSSVEEQLDDSSAPETNTIPDQSPTTTEDQEINTPDLTEMADTIIEQIEDAVEDVPAIEPDTPELNEQVQLIPVQFTNNQYAASDFPELMEVKRVYSISLMLSRAANPGLTENSTPIQPIMPEILGSKPWANALAWTVAITELVTGLFLVLGLFTRLSAMGTFVVMCVAMWMTQLGPAIIQDQSTILGFIPKASDPWAPSAYMGLLWQLGLAGMSLAVFFLGSGAIGVDRLIFKPTSRDPYIHGDPKAAKNGSQPNGADRSEFDRTPNPTP